MQKHALYGLQMVNFKEQMEVHMMRLSVSGILSLLSVFLGCSENSVPVSPPQHTTTPLVIETGIQLAVGNRYHWRYTEITNSGSIFQWETSDSIVERTTIDGGDFYVMRSGITLRSVGDIIYAFTSDSVSVYYRFDVAVGQAAPMMGQTLTVAGIETSAVFSDTQRVITLAPQLLSPSGLDQVRYSTTFGLLETIRSTPTSVTRGILVGARIGATTYGY